MIETSNNDQLYAKFGRTAELAQQLETEVGNVILGIVAIPIETAEITEEERAYYQALLDDINKRPLGSLLKCIRPWIEVDEKVVTLIDSALERRNYLIHRYFRAHNFRIFSNEGREIMTRDLDEVWESLSVAIAHLGALALLLEKLAGREGNSMKYAEKFVRLGKKIDLGEG